MQLTDSARQVLGLARDEAHRLRHEYIGTEHLVLGLTKQQRGIAVTTLQNLHIDVNLVREMIEATVRPGTAAASPKENLPFTSRTQRVFALAEASAQTLEQADVGAEHLLIGVVGEGKGIGGQVLLHYGLAEKAVIDEIRRMKNASDGPK